MLARIQECILYRGFSNGEILDDMTELINLYEADEEALKAREDQFFKSVNGLVELAGMYGFSGNIWHTYLTFLLVNHENAFSMASEIRGAIEGSINELAKNDFQIFKELYDFDITVFDKVFGTVCCKVICDYQTPDENSKLFNTRIREIKTAHEQEKALKETIIRVKKNSIEEHSAKLDPTDIQGLQKLMEAKRALQDLEKLHISIN